MTPLVPPLPAPPLPQVRPPIWPTALGVLSIVSGINVLVGGGWTVAARTLQSAIEGATVGGNIPQISVILLQHLLALAATAMGVTGGALLVKRRPVGCTLLLIYAIVRLAHLLIQPLVLLFGYGEIGYSPSYGLYNLSAAVISLLLHAPYPIVLLVWLRRRKVRQQTDAMRDPLRRAAMRPATGSAWPVVIGLLLVVVSATSVLSLGLHLTVRPLILGISGRGYGYGSFGDLSGILILLARLMLPSAAGIIAGLGLLGRRRWAGVLAPIWAALAILSVLAGVFQVVKLVQSIVPGVVGFDFYGFLLGQLMSVISQLVLPVFVLIWMLLPKNRAQMSAWPRRHGRST